MRRRIPSISALLAFEAAAKLQNFARAAEELNLSQSAVSRQIQSLEDFVGQSLFHRSKQRVRLTTAGIGLMADLSPLLEEMELSLLKVKTHDSEDGSLNLGVYPTLGSRWLMPILMQPKADLARSSFNLITYLKNSEIDSSLIDLAIVQGNAPWPGFRADRLMPETLLVVGAPDILPGSVDDPTALLDCRILQHATRPRSWEIWFENLGVPLNRKIIGPVFSQFEMLIDAVKSGHGIAIIPRVLIHKELANGTLIPLNPFEASTESAYFLLTPDRKVGVARIERMRSWLLENAQD
ncbi:LysR substrate-binding domain-containing protein [uncultured Ruegeria sp.]|uniref:LysR substrate-binding domain-containing protein n=1 Tax=uncultured Ruegeria sp. TaxID=259304 RepID=UPI00262C521B|nr:LysR substrate-binding domain-containing protein [uncultured Ruegeria sp.]